MTILDIEEYENNTLFYHYMDNIIIKQDHIIFLITFNYFYHFDYQHIFIGNI